MRATTRRGLLAGAAAAPAVLTAAPAPARPEGDSSVLRAALRLEHAARFAYGAALGSGSGTVREIAQRFGAHENAHVSALATDLEALGAAKPVAPRAGDAVDAIARELRITPVLSELRTPDDALRFMIALEEALVEHWIAAHRELADARLVQTATSILCCQAQHLVVLRQALGHDPLSPALG